MAKAQKTELRYLSDGNDLLSRKEKIYELENR